MNVSLVPWEAWARGDLLFLSDLEVGKGEKSRGQRAYLPFHHFLKLMRQCQKKTVLLESDRKQLLSISIFLLLRMHDAMHCFCIGWAGPACLMSFGCRFG